MDTDRFVDNNYYLFFKKMFSTVSLTFSRSIRDENHDKAFLNYTTFNINHRSMYNSPRDVRQKANIKHAM